MTVFVPVSAAEVSRWRSVGWATGLVGYADGPALRRWLGDERLDDEQADYVALNHAGVAALTMPDPGPIRLVLALDIDGSGADELGAVGLARAEWTRVRSLFADAPEAGDAVLAARAAVAGTDLATALADPAVVALQDGYDLLWFAPEELDALLGA